MKQNKLSKSIKYLSLIFFIIFSITILAISLLATINFDVMYQKDKTLVFNLIKYVLFGISTASLSIPILLSIQHFRKFKSNINSIINAIKITLMFVIITVLVIFLFVESRKYGVHVELWYGHRVFFISLIVLLDCLFFEYFMNNSKKFVSKQNDKLTPEQTLVNSISFNSFISESIWLTIGSILGFVMMFFFQKVTQYCFAWSLILMTYIVLNYVLIFCLSIKIKSSSKKANKTNSNAILAILIASVIATIFIASAYYSIFPVRIIETIKMNYIMCGWGFVFALAFVPTSILTCKKLM